MNGSKPLLICLTGMPGAGKSTVASFLADAGYDVVIMGDCVREEAQLRNLDLSDENLGKLMITLREEGGQGAIANLVIKKIKEMSKNHINKKSIFLIDGIRSTPELKILSNYGLVKIIAIHASTNVRFNHIKTRSREDAPTSIEEYSNRDSRELKIGVSEAIALADEVINNNNISLTELKNQAIYIVDKWKKEYLEQ